MYSTNKHRHQQYPDTDENPTNEIRPQIVSRRLSEVEPDELDWLGLERVPLGKLTLLAGDPGLGKSFLTLDMAARVSRGEPWPDDPATLQPVGSVILFSAEDDLADTIRPRLDKADADVSRIMAVEGVQWSDAEHDESGVRHFSLENDLPRLEELITENPGTRLVVIDPISAFCGRTDSHKNSEVRALLSPLAQLASKHSVAVVAVTHLSKSMNNKAVYRAMGSLAFAAAARAVWAVTKAQNDPDRRLLLPVKMNLSPNETGLAYSIINGRVEWEPDPVQLTAEDAFAAEIENVGNGKGQERREAAEFLREELANGPRPSKEIIGDAKERGISVKTLRRAYKDMSGKPQKNGMTGGWEWGLPSEDAHEDAEVAHHSEVGIFGESGHLRELETKLDDPNEVVEWAS